jgi:hypothetical protein
MKRDQTAQCRFFSAEDACRIALQAYFAAGRRITPPPGEPFVVDGVPWAGKEEFADAFVGELRARVGLLAFTRLGEFYRTGVEWDVLRLAADVDPEKISPLLVKRNAEIAAMWADFYAEEKNGLHSLQNAADNASLSGVINGE